MKVKVKEIPRDGLEIQTSLTAESLGLVDDDFKSLTPLKVNAEVRKADDAIIADVTVEAQYEFSCARCLEATVRDRVDEFKIYIDLEPNTEIIDLGDEIRQELLVTISPIVLCREDCPGPMAR